MKCWGYEWRHDPHPKVFHGHTWALTKIQDGWLAETHWGMIARDAVAADPEEALEAILGPPIKVGNLWFYPQAPVESPAELPVWRLYRGYHGPRLFRLGSEWACGLGGYHPGEDWELPRYPSPEEAVAGYIRLEGADLARGLQEAHQNYLAFRRFLSAIGPEVSLP